VTDTPHQAACLMIRKAGPDIDDWLKRAKAPTASEPVDGRGRPHRFDKVAWEEHERKQNPLRALGIKASYGKLLA